jgi:hypothetical protein
LAGPGFEARLLTDGTLIEVGEVASERHAGVHAARYRLRRAVAEFLEPLRFVNTVDGDLRNLRDEADDG